MRCNKKLIYLHSTHLIVMCMYNLALMSLFTSCGFSADSSTVNTNTNTDSHDQGIVSCKAECNLNKDAEIVLNYFSFNGGICASQVVDSLDICKAAVEETPVIETPAEDVVIEDFNNLPVVNH